MCNVLHLTSPIPPSVNHFTGTRVIMKYGRPMAITYTTNEAKKYKSDFSSYVIEEVKRQGWALKPNGVQHFYVDAVFYFKTTASDPSNAFKCLLDSITNTQLIWLDDNVACERVQAIYYDSTNPRIELTIRPVDYIGIFDNQDALDSFEQKCKSCTRYCRNCSILNKAKEGRIQEEIADGVCAKYKEIKDYDKNK